MFTENVNVSFLRILSEIEENLMYRLELLQNSLQNNVYNNLQNNVQNDLQNNLQNQFEQNNEPYKSDVLRELKKLDIKLPVQDLKSFTKLEMELKNDLQKRNALVNIF